MRKSSIASVLQTVRGGANQNMDVLRFQILREGHLISVNHHTPRAANESIKRP